MDEDKIDRTIEIILQQQAQFYADMQKMQESQSELRESQMRSEKRIDILQEVAFTLLDSAKETSKNIADLTVKVDRISDKVEKLADAQIDTDERLNAVIYMAEKFFSDKQNGNSN